MPAGVHQVEKGGLLAGGDPRRSGYLGWLLAIWVLTPSSWAGQGNRNLFVVRVSPNRAETKLVALAAVAASAKANGGAPCTLFLDDRDAQYGMGPVVLQFLQDCQFERIYCVGEVPLHTPRGGARAVQISGKSSSQAWWNVVERFWNTTSSVVLADTQDMSLALRSAAVAAILGAPLVPGKGTHVLPSWVPKLRKLRAQQILVVGSSPRVAQLEDSSGLTVYSGNEQSLLAARGVTPPRDYVALCNPWDAYNSRCLVPGLSLLAPVIAAYRRGTVLPVTAAPDRIVVTGASLPVVHRRPKGCAANARCLTAGGRARPARGSLTLGSSRQFAALAVDGAIAIDLDKDGQFGPHELFRPGQTARLGEFKLGVERVAGELGKSDMRWLSYRVGHVRHGDRHVALAVSCAHFGGYFDHVSVDLDGDGTLETAGDVAASAGGSLTVAGTEYDLLVHHEDGAPVEFRAPSSQTFLTALRQKAPRGAQPLFVALVGHWDVVPDALSEVALEYKPPTPVGLSDVTFPGTSGYERLGVRAGARVAAVGRITGPGLGATSLMVCKTVAMELGWLPRGQGALILQRGEAGFSERSLREAIAKLESAGIHTKWSRDPVTARQVSAHGVLLAGGHATPNRIPGLGFGVATMPLFRSPALVVVGGCDAGKTDPPLQYDDLVNFIVTGSMAMRAVANGAVGYIGDSRHGSEFPNLSVFADRLPERSVGEALLAAKKSGNSPRNCAVTNLVGDPAMRVFRRDSAPTTVRH